MEQRCRKSEPDSVCAEGIDPNDRMNDGLSRVIGAYVGSGGGGGESTELNSPQ